MHLRSNQSCGCFTTAKTYEFESAEDILRRLKLHPIIDQTGTYIYNALKVVAKYLTPYLRMTFPLQTVNLPELLKNSSNDDSLEDVSYNYDLESLFTSTPVQEIIDYILQIIYVHKEINLFVKNQYSKSCY